MLRLTVVRSFSQRFEIDLEHCPNCGEQLKIIAAILESAVVERILTHLGLQARAPPRTPARERPRMVGKNFEDLLNSQPFTQPAAPLRDASFTKEVTCVGSTNLRWLQPLASSCLGSTSAGDQLVLKLKTPWRDGTTHLVMLPLEFMQRLAALVPRPRLHLIRLVSA